MKKVLKFIGLLVALVILAVGSYVAYIFLAYERIPDNGSLKIESFAHGGGLNPVTAKDSYRLVSWNVGFGAYTADFGFFMDGGTESRGRSKEAITENLDKISDKIATMKGDFMFLQEVDLDSTRSYHVNQEDLLANRIWEDYPEKPWGSKGSSDIITDKSHPMSYSFAINYDSPFLFYPISKPLGSSKSGLMTISTRGIDSSLRRSLPVQTGFAKFMDLDRCYSISRIPTNMTNPKGEVLDLVLINLHLSAYTTDPTIVHRQLEMLYDDMMKEKAKGNYVIAGGDFNKDLLGDSSQAFGVKAGDFTWAQPYPFETIPDGFSLLVPHSPKNPVATCRNADGPWDRKTQFQVSIDGFLVSDNVSVNKVAVEDTDFQFSDHNPIILDFQLVG